MLSTIYFNRFVKIDICDRVVRVRFQKRFVVDLTDQRAGCAVNDRQSIVFFLFHSLFDKRNGIRTLQGIKFRRYKLFLYKQDRKSTRLNSSHVSTSYAVFCLKKITRYQTSLRESCG